MANLNFPGGLGSYSAYILLALTALAVLAWKALHISMDPREPPLIRPKIPLVGHLIGMLRYQTAYFEKLR